MGIFGILDSPAMGPWVLNIEIPDRQWVGVWTNRGLAGPSSLKLEVAVEKEGGIEHSLAPLPFGNGVMYTLHWLCRLLCRCGNSIAQDG